MQRSKGEEIVERQKAEIAKREPFTIRLLWECENNTQPVTLGVDAGSKHIGLSATTEKKELYAAEIELRNDIVNLLSTRRETRRTRRSRLRYRKARFDNRKRGDGWLAPSVDQKIQTHLRAVENIIKILPVTQIIVETASFDIQKLKNPNIQGKEYQQGEQLDFWNVREYVLHRDNHTCQCCKGKSKDKILNVHHIESRKVGGNAPNNLITLCETCHNGHHNGSVSLPKEHYVDARCISGNPTAEPLGYYFYQKKVRCHNRQIHKNNILKGGKKKQNQAPYIVRGFRLFDKVKYGEQICFIFGRRTSGYFDLRTLDGKSIHKSASHKKIELITTRKSFLTERRMQGEGVA